MNNTVVVKRDAIHKALLYIRDNKRFADIYPDLLVSMWDKSESLVNHLYLLGFLTHTQRMLLWNITKRYFWK